MSVPQQGSEQRTSILPNMIPSGIGFFGSPYSPANAMLTPPQIGVTVGDSMSDVISAVKGVGFYADQIGFGAPSTGLTNGMPLQPLGINYFIKTGQTCSNGAEMWRYFQGIPEGNALGDNVKRTMEEMGMPPLKGLAPGMIEDAENALNPAPLIGTLLGSGYPQCKQVTLQVGDSYGRISDPLTGENWIENPETAFKKDGKYFQTRWIQDTDSKGKPINLTRDQWVSSQKTFNKNGTPIERKESIEKFENIISSPISVIILGAICLAAFSMLKTN